MDVQALYLLVLEHGITGESRKAGQAGWGKERLRGGNKRSCRMGSEPWPNDLQSMAYIPEICGHPFSYQFYKEVTFILELLSVQA